MYTALTDEKIADLLKEGDTLALETLFNRYYKSLCQLCTVYTKNYAEAEEIVANLFIKLWDNRQRLAILSIKSYLFVSAKNLSLNYCQKKKSPVDLFEDISFLNDTVHDSHTPFHVISGKESYKKILLLIDTLPPVQRQVLLMNHIDNLNKQEIAVILSISIRTVETTLYQGIKKLRVLLQNSPDFTSGT